MIRFDKPAIVFSIGSLVGSDWGARDETVLVRARNATKERRLWEIACDVGRVMAIYLTRGR